jgi:hypothetical protein
VIDLLRSRYMFRNERIRTCAGLLDRDGGRPGHETYTRSLATALFAAVADLDNDRRGPSPEWSLNGTHWSAICKYIVTAWGGRSRSKP